MATPFHSRADWGARPARYVTRRTLSMNTAHYGGPSPWGSGVDRSSAARFYATADHNRCATIVRAYQAFHLDSRGWADIAYSSLVCPHGHRYEGRGLDARTAAQGTTVGNNTSHATCYIAGAGDPLTQQAMAAFIDESRRLRGLEKGHRDWKSTACPGDPLYAWVHSGQNVPGGGSLPTPSPTPLPDGFPGTVEMGDEGPVVSAWQAEFKKMGYDIEVDGDFGPATNHVVVHFQTEHDLVADGIAGPETWKALTAITRKPAPKPDPEPESTKEYDKMLHIVKGDKTAEWWFTDFVTKRHIKTARQAAEVIWITAVLGGKVSYAKGNQPHVLPQSSVDAIPTAEKGEGPRDPAIELRVIDVRNAIEELTEAVKAFGDQG